MDGIKTSNPAFGWPGIAPRWTRSSKDGVGTAYSTSSKVWYTISRGILNEIYYPRIDQPQVRDLQYLISDGESFVHTEKHHLNTSIQTLSTHALGFEIYNTEPNERYRIRKRILSAPHQDTVLIETELQGDELYVSKLKLYALLAPHLRVGGWGNSGYVVHRDEYKILVANKAQRWLALGATIPFLKCSCGFVGKSDGWTDLNENYKMDWEFDCAENGNIALTGELDLTVSRSFVLGLAFGDSLHNAVTTLLQSLDVPFELHLARFTEQWERSEKHLLPLGEVSSDGGKLYHMSHSLLSGHEDKTYEGALIASMSVPWGNAKGDEDLGGYHLVWTRDMVQSATAMLAAGTIETPLRSLIYLACSQHDNGGFSQNFWISGKPYWSGIQLDEVAFPIILAWRLNKANVLRYFDPYSMVMQAARHLILQGPVTQQERWEENSGYSPSTLASNIAALTCAADWAREKKDFALANFIQEHADFVERHVEEWTVTTDGSLVPGIKKHYIRIHPVSLFDPHPNEDPNSGTLTIKNQPSGAPFEFRAKDIVDAGFLELVRYGIRKAGDPLMEDSLQVIDKVLKIDTPYGPCWHRYNYDGYGERFDGSPYQGSGKGRAWPLLTGERGHYELAAGRSAKPFIEAIEGFAQATGLLPEQIWDEADKPQKYLFLGRPTGSAMPLMWAHAEYIKLLRSTKDGQVFDLIPPVAERYTKGKSPLYREVWKFNRRLTALKAGTPLRILAEVPFVLHWTFNEWQEVHDTQSTQVAIQLSFVDLVFPIGRNGKIRFTFFWPGSQVWEGKDFEIAVEK